MHQHDPKTSAHLFYADGRPVSGAAPDQHGRWTWWAISTHGRRMPAANGAEAIAQARAAHGGSGGTPT